MIKDFLKETRTKGVKVIETFYGFGFIMFNNDLFPTMELLLVFI